MPKEFLMGNAAFAHAALEAGVNVVAGYPGTPSSEVIETVASLHDAGRARGVHVEWSTNEKAALELLAGASYAGARTLYTCKQMGLNVASDALMSLNYVGIKGGCVLFVADDPGPISSQTEQDTRRFAAFAKVPVFDPSTPDEGFAMMKQAFELSEAYGTPVIVRATTRVCHASTFFEVAEHTDARPIPEEGFVRDPKWIIFPNRAYAAHGEINDRLAAIAGKEADAAATVETCGTDPTTGIVAGGVSSAYTREALRCVEDACGRAGKQMPPYRLMNVGMPYPFPHARAKDFACGLDTVVVFEELDFVLEDEMLRLAGAYHLPYRVMGKTTDDTLTRGENSTEVIAQTLNDLWFDGALDLTPAAPTNPDSAAAPQVPARPPVLCAGCPHRGSFYAIKRALGRTPAVLCGDIGCYTLGNAKPLEAVDTCLCMGAGITMAQGFAVAEPGKKCLAFVGDSTFFASGMTGIANAVYNGHDICVVVLDNATTAMTGSQPHPGTGVTLMGGQSKPIDIEGVLRALGVECIVHADPFHFEQSKAAATQAIDYSGPSAIIFEGPCVSLVKPGTPAAVDTETCTACKQCITRIGCPAIAMTQDGSAAHIDTALCTGCGLCVDICPFDSISVEGRKGAEGNTAHARKDASC